MWFRWSLEVHFVTHLWENSSITFCWKLQYLAMSKAVFLTRINRKHFVTHSYMVATVHCLSDFGGTELNQGFSCCPLHWAHTCMLKNTVVRSSRNTKFSLVQGGNRDIIIPSWSHHPINPFSPDIKMYILITDLHRFLMELVRRICLNIKPYYPQWTLPLFLSRECSDKWWSCTEKFHFHPGLGLEGLTALITGCGMQGLFV